MALFQKKPQASDSAPLYTLGLQKTILVVGLGNPGDSYVQTRHNIGFLCVEALAEKNDAPKWINKKDLKALVSLTTIGDKRVVLLKPTTFMNESGEAVQAAQHFYKISNKDTLVIHDELDMSFGQIRTRLGGSSAGHNGLKSIITHCGEGFGRVRIGVKNELAEKMDSADFVLANFSKEEKAELPTLTREAVSITSEYLASGELPHDTRTFIL